MTASRSTRSFSGCHTFNLACMIEALTTEMDVENLSAETATHMTPSELGDSAREHADYLFGEISAGWCPRCGDQLLPENLGKALPAGSRATACHCVPMRARLLALRRAGDVLPHAHVLLAARRLGDREPARPD